VSQLKTTKGSERKKKKTARSKISTKNPKDPPGVKEDTPGGRLLPFIPGMSCSPFSGYEEKRTKGLGKKKGGWMGLVPTLFWTKGGLIHLPEGGPAISHRERDAGSLILLLK